MTHYDTQAQLADLQAATDFDAWADARCAEYEAEEDARHCLGGANDARSCGVVDCDPCDEIDPRPYQEVDYGDYDEWYEREGVYREAEDRALSAAYGYRF